MAEKIATRAAYGEALAALAEEYPQLVVLDADLSGSTMTKGFAKAHPERFYNMGIAEANMMGVAAGLKDMAGDVLGKANDLLDKINIFLNGEGK